MKRPVRLRKGVRKLTARDVERGRTLEAPLPPKPAGMAWRDYLIMLLHIGAELEHSLMVEYLYAAYSLNDQTGTARQRHKVGEWRNAILSVAKEEMGHLLTVQNLLCLLGGAVCFSRSHFPKDTPYLPFPFRLEPVSTKLLAWYVYAEAPEDWQSLLRTHSQNRRLEVEEDMRRVAEIVGKQVVAGHAHTVGQVYARILELIADPVRIPDSVFRPDTYEHQASWDDWGRGYAPPPAKPGETKPPPTPHGERSYVLIMQMATRTQAVAALQAISGQGEAPHLGVKDSDEPSHFVRFLKIFDEFQREGKDWNVVYRVPRNPTTIGRQDRPAGSTSIEQKTSLRWATLFNLRYRALLAYLSHTFRLARLVSSQEPNARGAVMHKIFGEMYNLKAIAGILVRRPLKNSRASGRAGTTRFAEDGPRAAPPFEMPYTTDVSMDEPDWWHCHQDILRSSLEIGQAILRGKDPQSPPLTGQEEAYLRTLQQLDEQSLAWVDAILGGLLRTRKPSK